MDFNFLPMRQIEIDFNFLDNVNCKIAQNIGNEDYVDEEKILPLIS